MPFVQIHLPQHLTDHIKETISLSVHESLVETFNVPADDYFQVINALSPVHLRVTGSYMDIPHTADMVYVHITARAGRTTEMKQRLYTAIAEKISTRTEILINDVMIILSENQPDCWSFGQGIAQMVNSK